MTSDRSQGQGSNSESRANLIAESLPNPTPRPNNVVPLRKPNNVIDFPRPPSTIPTRAAEGVLSRRAFSIIIRGAGRLAPAVGWGLTANDLLELAELTSATLYDESIRGQYGTSGNFEFPSALAPAPYRSTQYPTDSVGDRRREPGTVMEDYVGSVLRDPRGNTNHPITPIDPQPSTDPSLPESNPTPPELDLPTIDESWIWPEWHPSPEIPGSEIPTIPYTEDWMGRPQDSGSPAIEQKPVQPLRLPTVPQIRVAPLNLNGQGPSISGDRNTFNTRASQEQASEPAETTDPATPEPATETPPDQQEIEKLEAQKLKIEQKVANLSKGRRNIANLPNGVEEQLNKVGYIIKRGDAPSIAYIGVNKDGKTIKLPSGSQLHLEKDETGVLTIEPGPSNQNNRESNLYEAKKNLLEGTSVKSIPSGYQAHHITADNVWQDSGLLKEYDRRSNRKHLDRQENMILMPESQQAAENGRDNPDAQTLKDQDLLLGSLHHNGSHDEWDKFAKELYDQEERDLKRDYGSLEKAPLEEIEKRVKAISRKGFTRRKCSLRLRSGHIF